ncbi:F-box domain-containing protein [Caenorhabditis elegans]|uniref:F-box domain-containing protein n=1 Tax=Caenorhabditis elegans TaxID=6239 RepID=Q86MH2_CAEEL|nr:F-box domain-containing protein [Caenorhabditis elegans]CCD73096.1 F-box domain-containing protein [Caenorhabditis elegans]|eukprot:NP_001023331.1 F-box B protein [Caenorhabditis elegans]
MAVFTLLNLPEKSLNYVLRRMPLTELIGFALISKTTKDQAERLNVKMRSLNVSLDGAIRIHISDGSDNVFPPPWFFKFLVSKVPKQPSKREFILMTSGGRNWTNPEFGVRQFLDHVLEIWHLTKIYLCCLEIDCDANTIRDMFDGLEISLFQIFFRNLVNPFVQKMLTTFSRQSEQVSWRGNPFPLEDSHKIQAILGQFIHSVYLPSYFNDIIPLNDLLIADNVSICIGELRLRDVNIYLKYWIHGSNTKLECVRLYLDRRVMRNENILEVLLKNVEYQMAPPEREFVYIRAVGSEEHIRGGIVVQRNDGTMATIVLNHENSYFEMFVHL